MRLLWPKIYYYDYDNYIFYRDEYPLKQEHKTGDDTQKYEFRLQFFSLSKYVEICRIRGPPSLFKKKFLKGEQMERPKRRKYRDNPYTLKKNIGYMFHLKIATFIVVASIITS